MVRLGLFKFCIGGFNIFIDWVYGDNLVYVQLLVSMVFIDDLFGRLGIFFVVGQVYFILDGMFLIFVFVDNCFYQVVGKMQCGVVQYVNLVVCVYFS